MKLEYLIEDPEIINQIDDYSSDTIVQNIYDLAGLSMLSISAKGYSREVAKALSIIHLDIMDKNRLRILTDGPSEYFNKDLFPHFNKFETKLRKLIHLAFALKKRNDHELENVEENILLEEMTFGDLFNLLFIDPSFVVSIKKLVNEKSNMLDKRWMLEKINNHAENTLWDKLMNLEDSILRDKFRVVRSKRNTVMHAGFLTFQEYINTLNLLKAINEELDLKINNFTGQDDEEYLELAGFYDQFTSTRALVGKIADYAVTNNILLALTLFKEKLEIVSELKWLRELQGLSKSYLQEEENKSDSLKNILQYINLFDQLDSISDDNTLDNT